MSQEFTGLPVNGVSEVRGDSDSEFILQNRAKDVRSLALSRIPNGVNAQWCLQQIEGWQIAKKKLPSWAKQDGLWFPPKLSLEQCSSEQTAEYKRDVVERLLPKEHRNRMVDFTAGYGIDFSFLAPLFENATYVEKNPQLCEIARHNFPLLGLENTEIKCTDKFFPEERIQLAFFDPARRNDLGRKTVAIEDCTPDISVLQDRAMDIADIVMVKLSPMLDISQALRVLKNVGEVHVVGVKGECKELLLVMGKNFTETIFCCANLDEENNIFSCTLNERDIKAEYLDRIPEAGEYLYEPNACILKAGLQDILAQKRQLQKVHPQSNLFVSKERQEDYPGRVFSITGISDFSKKGLKAILSDLKQANLTIRNFPTSVAELRKKWKLKEGGDNYLFATTANDESHILVRCEKSSRR